MVSGTPAVKYSINIKGVIYDVLYYEFQGHDISQFYQGDDPCPKHYEICDTFVVAKRVDLMIDDPKTIPSIEHSAVINITQGDIHGEGVNNLDDLYCFGVTNLQAAIDHIRFPDSVDANKITHIYASFGIKNGDTTTNCAVVYCSDNYFTDTNSAIVCEVD